MSQTDKEKNDKNFFAQMEEEVLDFWDRSKTFGKSVKKSAPEGNYTFYDGPPFATGLPHYGHLAASIMKDAVPRYWTMKGFRVERRWGWDCHGLPVENLAEKELGLKNKQDIEAIGVEKFNNYCESIVTRYAHDWKKTIRRIGRWVDMDNDYKTMDTDYMESIWWVFKTLWDKGLIYQGYKSMHICPRCGTTLSNFEVTQGYKDIKDLSVTAMFELEDEPGTFLLAWTTTPWTLIGNVALAVGENLDYVLADFNANGENGNEGIKNLKKDKKYNIIVSKQYFEKLAAEKKLDKSDLQKTFKGSELAGKRYKPLFDYYQTDDLANKENGWKVYAAKFVTTEEGTGIVHIAPAFGEDDMNLGNEKKLPFIQHVDTNGRFKAEVRDWAGMEVKPKKNPQQSDRSIGSYLSDQGLLFGAEEYEHSYPHCWRCETPLLNYATDSWFVEVAKLKDGQNGLAGNNQNVSWVPEHVKDGRFGKWLEQARDWAISRNRYWGAPLPVWTCGECGEKKVFGSVAELAERHEGIAKIILLRHGESVKNIKHIFDASDQGFGLTDKGREETASAAQLLAKEKIDHIYCSPVQRARETAQGIISKIGGKIETAEELREVNSGNWEGKTLDDENVSLSRKRYHDLPIEDNYTAKRGGNGESWKDIEERSYAFVQKILKDAGGKTVLLVSHQGVIVYLLKALKNYSLEKTVTLFNDRTIEGHAVPVEIFVDAKTKKEVNLHKQFVDKIEFDCTKCGRTMRRVPEVLDCWFESGSMPYAQNHYMGKPLPGFDPAQGENFPANFIAEGMDQTRGWFYTLMVLATALFNKEAFKNVIVNGIVLAEDGQKMSKSKGNYPDPSLVFEKYSADAMRYYLLSSAVLTGENLNFTQEGVKEVLRNVSMTYWNIFKFYSIFSESAGVSDTDVHSENILDKWIMAKLDKVKTEITAAMDRYNLPKAVRPAEEFISEFSTWYIRRSRDRFKSDDEQDKAAAIRTTRHVLIELSKLIAPFMPFVSEMVWQKVSGFDFKDEDRSVHLEEWPKSHNVERITHNEGQGSGIGDQEILKNMELVRKIVELGLAERDKAGIKVRQPLAALEFRISNDEFQIDEDYLDLIKDEINVKKIIVKKGEGELEVGLDAAMTDELIAEGCKREIVRFVNAMRKDANLTIKDRIALYWQADDEGISQAIKRHMIDIKKDTLADSIEDALSDNYILSKEVLFNGKKLWLAIKQL